MSRRTETLEFPLENVLFLEQEKTMSNFLKICACVCLTAAVSCAGGGTAKQGGSDLQEASAPAEEAADDFAPVLGKVWKLESAAIGSEDSGFSRDALGEERSEFYTLSFNADEMRITGKAAPNSYFADYRREGGDLSFGVIASTKMFAFNEPETLKEHEYCAYLQESKRWELAEGALKLYSADAEGAEVILTFRAD